MNSAKYISGRFASRYTHHYPPPLRGMVVRSARAINRLKKTRIRNLLYGPRKRDDYYMASSRLGDGKQVQDVLLDNHLTGVKKESFYRLTKTIAHIKGFPRKWKQIRRLKKFIWSKLRALWVLAGVFWKPGIFLEVVSIFPPLVLVKKKNTAKGKEAFQGKFVVIVEQFAR